MRCLWPREGRRRTRFFLFVLRGIKKNPLVLTPPVREHTLCLTSLTSAAGGAMPEDDPSGSFQTLLSSQGPGVECRADELDRLFSPASGYSEGQNHNKLAGTPDIWEKFILFASARGFPDVVLSASYKSKEELVIPG